MPSDFPERIRLVRFNKWINRFCNPVTLKLHVGPTSGAKEGQDRSQVGISLNSASDFVSFTAGCFAPLLTHFNFTPAHVHQLNNKSVLLQELNAMKRKTREKRKAYWAEQQNRKLFYAAYKLP